MNYTRDPGKAHIALAEIAENLEEDDAADLDVALAGLFTVGE